MEARLFPAGTVPEFTTHGFFAAHPWTAPGDQVGHAERTAMVAGMIRRIAPASMVDLGCGDGSLLAELPGLNAWGYDAGVANVERARAAGLDVRLSDIEAVGVEYGDLIVCSEVVEHLLDPHGFIAALPGTQLVLSSPSAETAEWHYTDHAWAWDLAGYRQMIEAAGWAIWEQEECVGPPYDHVPGDFRPVRFQAVYATR